MYHPWYLLRSEICFQGIYAQCYNIWKSFKLKRVLVHMPFKFEFSFMGGVDYNILLKVINSYVCICVYVMHFQSKMLFMRNRKYLCRHALISINKWW